MSEVVDITDETEASDAICASSSRFGKSALGHQKDRWGLILMIICRARAVSDLGSQRKP